jgi:beta-mannosidase
MSCSPAVVPQEVRLDWTVGPATSPSSPPSRRVPATVPGAVQLDWARAENWPPYWHGDNFRAYDGLEDQHWIYAARVPPVDVSARARLLLEIGGVDYRWEVRVDGVVRHAQEGMFTPAQVDLTDCSSTGADLEIVVYPAPKLHPEPADRTQASHVVKPPVSYGWDWHPRLIPLGIWEETRLVVRPAARLCDAELRYTLADDFSSALLAVEISATPAARGGRVRWMLQDPSGQTAADGAALVEGTELVLHHTLPGPQLWWPHDHGAQPLYLLSVELRDPDGALLDTRTHRTGFRRVRLVMHEGAWAHPAAFPKSRSHPPITIEINGRSIFAKGTNWVAPEIFPGRVTAETVAPLLRLARETHFNLLRCWGGAPAAKESFFAQCDELGLLVWQEFPLACNLYEHGAPYLQVLDRESRSILRRVRRHPCLALWCGGNELFNVWSGMTDQSLALRLLNRNCYELDPATPFIPTAPLEGMAHGDYRFRDTEGREVFQIYAGAAATAYSEFGVPGASPVDYLRTFMPAGELWPPRAGTAWETHHGLGAWGGHPSSWLCEETLRHYFGESSSLEELVARSQWLQAEGYRCIYEEARRQKPRCAMALNWCFNEPWPSAANNSLVNWPARPKPALAAVAAACRPTLASARLPQFSWTGGETFRAELWLLHDAPVPRPGAVVFAALHFGAERLPLAGWPAPAAAANRNTAGPEVRATLPPRLPGGAGEFELVLTVEDHPSWESRYRLHFRPARESPPAVPGRRYATPTLNV